MNNITRPAFSILIANFNHADLVERAIDSVLAQDYPAALREVVVVDDGSTDGSRTQLARYQQTPGVRVVFQDNRGQTAAFAAALAVAQADFVCLLDADDTFLPDKLERIAVFLAQLDIAPEALFLCHDLAIKDGADGAAIATSWFEVAGLHRYGASLHLARANHFFPFSVTSGQVYGRRLLVEIMDQLPLWDWPMGADAVLGHAAMLLAGEVQYLPEILGSYVVHKNNNFASIDAGVFRPKPVWHGRWPKQLRLMEALIDSMDLTERDRGDRLGYLGRVEYAVRAVPSGRRLASPLFSFVLDACGDLDRVDATVAAIRRQTHGHCEMVWVGGPADPARPLELQMESESRVEVAGGASQFSRLRAGFLAARGSYLCFLDACDVPDHRFAERHIHVHRFGDMPMVTVSDIRLIDGQNMLLHVGAMGTVAAWSAAPMHLPSFSGGLRDWHLAPLPAVVFRRSPFLAAFFDTAQLGGHDRLAGWLLCQFMQQLGGCTRLLENLLDYRVRGAATVNPFWLAQPCDHEGALPIPDFAWAAQALFAAYCRARSEHRAYFSPAWEVRFLQWLVHSGGAASVTFIEQHAKKTGDAPWSARVSALLRVANSRQ